MPKNNPPQTSSPALNRRSTLTLLLAPGAGPVWGSAKELRIGASAALSGPAQALGTRYHAGAAACFEQVNRQEGRVQGSRITVDLRDDGYEPERTEANTQAMLADARVLALFGYVGTPTSRMALPLVKRAQIAFLGAYTGADMLWEAQNHPTVFNVRASYREEARQLMKAARADGVQQFSVMLQADLFGRSGLEAARDAGQAEGLQMLTAATVKRNTTEVDGAVQALLNGKAMPDAIFLVSAYSTCAAFIKQARKAGFKGRFYTLSFAGLEPLQAALGKDMQGLTIAQVVPNAQDASLPVVAAYQQAMREHGERQFDSISLEGYVAARVLVEGLRRAAQPLSRASVIRGLESLGHLDLGGFALRYSAGTHQGSQKVLLLRNGGR
ncbi:ABC transporter substrate-binding protein [Roseateles sp.]|jgi:branched-chain amino acid transport system substrate-binding protein|uniref:ABC transporter substrate-binding protein n=1 Tax=Roseateles sp. TaxID=1971397 RepID=UPI0037C5BF4E